MNGNGTVGNLLPVKESLSLGTQTSLDQWPEQPYEHLIPAVYPFNQQDVEDKNQGFCPYELLDECIQIGMNEHSLSHNIKQDLKKESKASSTG